MQTCYQWETLQHVSQVKPMWVWSMVRSIPTSSLNLLPSPGSFVLIPADNSVAIRRVSCHYPSAADKSRIMSDLRIWVFTSMDSFRAGLRGRQSELSPWAPTSGDAKLGEVFHPVWQNTSGQPWAKHFCTSAWCHQLCTPVVPVRKSATIWPVTEWQLRREHLFLMGK